MNQVEHAATLPAIIGTGPHVTYLRLLNVALTRIMSAIAIRLNEVLPKDGTEGMDAPIVLKSYLSANRPTASSWTGGVIFVSDAAGGSKFQGSDGTSWVSLG